MARTQAGSWESWVLAVAGDFGYVLSSSWETRGLAPMPLMWTLFFQETLISAVRAVERWEADGCV